MVKPAELIFSILGLPPMFYTSIFNCLLGIYTWMSPKNLRVNILQTEFITPPCFAPKSVNGTTVHLMAQARNLASSLSPTLPPLIASTQSSSPTDSVFSMYCLSAASKNDDTKENLIHSA